MLKNSNEPPEHSTSDEKSGEDNDLPMDGFLRLPKVLKLIRISRSSWLEGVKEGRFPQPVRLGPNTVAWRTSDIRAFIKNPSSFLTEKDEGKDNNH